MKTINIETKDLTFLVEGIKVDHDSALKIWKKTYKSFPEFHSAIIVPARHAQMDELGDYMLQMWDSIEDITATEAFALKNVEIRRLYFKAIGVAEMFSELEPELIHKTILDKQGLSWDEKDKEMSTPITDMYELYKIQGSKLFPEESSSWRQENATVYAVRCWCSTTKREYWIYVPKYIGEKGDALEAIAWTVQLNITNPAYIHRQGDVIIAKASPESKECTPYHLEASQYKSLLISAS